VIKHTSAPCKAIGQNTLCITECPVFVILQVEELQSKGQLLTKCFIDGRPAMTSYFLFGPYDHFLFNRSLRAAVAMSTTILFPSI
jgi:hypothetical protein